MTPVISIVIPVHNKCSFTISCLRDLFCLDPADVEIIIVDNGSTDETEVALSYPEYTERPNFRYLRNEENRWHSAACNQGFAASSVSSGGVVLFLNNDIRVTGNKAIWTRAVVDRCTTKKMVEGAGPPPIVGLSSALLNQNFDFVREDASLLRGRCYLGGWFVAARRATWDTLTLPNQTGPWNEALPFYFNDVDLSWRAERAGFHLDVIKAPVVHFGKVSSDPAQIPALYHTGKKTFVDLWFNRESID